MGNSEKTASLHDGREVIIRQPSVENDLKTILAFFNGLPDEVRNVLRYNITEEEVCRRRLSAIDNQDHWRVVAELEGRIVGDATMDREPYGWTRHVALVRVVIHPQFLRMGLEPLLFAELVLAADRSGIERLVTELFSDQRDLIEELKREGFEYEFTRKNYAKDLKGRLHDIVIMSNDVGRVWRQLEEELHEMDIRYSGTFSGWQ